MKLFQALYLFLYRLSIKYSLRARLELIREKEEIVRLRALPGVTIPASVRFAGVPLIRLCASSSLSLGENCQLVSSNNLSAMGLDHPVFFRTLQPDAHITIGDETGISGGTFVAAIGINIGERVLIGANTTIIDTDFHPLKAEGRRFNDDYESINSAPILIDDDVFLGAGSIILKGVCIGKNAIVGAGSVVTKNVPPDSIVAGNPAKLVGKIPT